MPRPVNATDVNVVFCPGDQPTWFAIQNEGQPWYVVSRIPRQGYSLAVSQKVVVAYGRTILGANLSSAVKVLFVTAEELAKASCGATIGDKTVYANISGLASNDLVFATISGGFGRTDPFYVAGGSATQVRIEGVAEGPGDMLAYLLAQTGDRPKYLLRHGVDAPNRSLLAPLDFTSAEAAYTVRFPMTVAGGANANVVATFVSTRGTVRELGMTTVANGSGIYMALPQTLLATGDLHRQAATATDGRYTSVYSASLGQLDLTLGPVLPTPTVTSVGSVPALRMRATLPGQAEYPAFASATFYQGALFNRSMTVVVSAGYLGGSPSQWELEVPSLPFLLAEAQLQGGVETQWHVEAWNSSAGLFFGHGGATDGSVVRCAIATSLSTLTPRGCRSPLLSLPPGTPAELGAISLSP